MIQVSPNAGQSKRGLVDTLYRKKTLMLHAAWIQPATDDRPHDGDSVLADCLARK